jgi:tetratricopeptide (TPR) repeat protein
MKRLPSLLFLSAFGGGLVSAQSADQASNHTSQYWQASLIAETSKDYDLALTDVTEYQNAGGNAFLASLRTAWLYYLKQDYANAVKFYNAAEKLEPTSINPLLGLMNVSEAQADSATIEKSAEDVLHLDPLNYRAQMAIAYRHYLAKEYAMALASYRRVLTYYPDDMTALSGEAWSLFYLGQGDKAEADFKTLLGVNANDMWAQKGLALCQESKTN